MKWTEYGDKDAPAVLLIHGGGLNTWNYGKEAMLLKDRYHIILPIVDGHAGSDKPFTTIQNNAEDIISYIDTHHDGSVLLLGGLSLGAQIVLEILSLRRDICKYAIVESAAVIPSKITNAMIGPAFGSSYRLIKNKSFAKLQFKSLRIDPDYFDLYYRDTCLIHKEDLIAFMKANTSYSLSDALQNTEAKVHICIGQKENREIVSSAKIIHQTIRKSELHILDGLYHGEFSLNHPKLYVEYLQQMLQK